MRKIDIAGIKGALVAIVVEITKFMAAGGEPVYLCFQVSDFRLSVFFVFINFVCEVRGDSLEITHNDAVSLIVLLQPFHLVPKPDNFVNVGNDHIRGVGGYVRAIGVALGGVPVFVVFTII
ncbi:MAG: hypothetical protein HDQ90_08610 [Desulfovibrio sp.]|nr:hypothetical protein [Desulfovibrio sp.]